LVGELVVGTHADPSHVALFAYMVLSKAPFVASTSASYVRLTSRFARRLHILKVTHHGSNTSSTPLFLSRFPPKVAVIQCGADNPYGHPTPETLERLQGVGAKVFRNDEDGDVIATIKDQELNVAITKR
jgi:beta-lactamase superfamily II metal-dependent hydrolase